MDKLQHINGKKLYLDANPIIYFLNNNQEYQTIARNLFQKIDNKQVVAYAGELCLAELLVKPTKEKRFTEIQYIHELFDKGFIHLLAHPKEVFLLAVKIRVNNGLKMADALHVATALFYQCDIFVTADIKIAKSVTDIEVLDFNEFIEK